MNKITILGGGTAGWMTALFLQKTWPAFEISLVENPKQPPLIAGESGNAPFIKMFKYLDIDFNDWVNTCNATPKMGGRFTDWNGVGTEFLHPLQTELAPNGLPLEFTNDYLNKNNSTVYNMLSRMDGYDSKETYLKTIIANELPLNGAFFAGEFVDKNKFPEDKEFPIDIINMWHFDSRDTAFYLKNIGIERGIKLVEGLYTHATQDESGNITKIHLEDGRELVSDWFFDCSGFARLLLGKVLTEPLNDWSKYFPARAVVAWWNEPEYLVTTNAIAMKYGWSWNINLRHRAGNGYIYNPDLINLDQAIQEVEERFNKKIEPVANFQFTPGMMRNFYKNNVIAVGLSGGFMEPLEANGVGVIIEALFAVGDLWDPTTYDNPHRQQMNDELWSIAIDIRDFLALHYRGHRRDTEFWLSHANDKERIPESLSDKLHQWKMFYGGGNQASVGGYSTTAWLIVMQGLNLMSPNVLKQVCKDKLEIGQSLYQSNKEMYRQLVQDCVTIDEWIKEKGIYNA
jgi:tryptophan halogenase